MASADQGRASTHASDGRFAPPHSARARSGKGDMALRRKRRVKREPVLDTIGSLFHLRLSESDRPGGAPERASGSKGEKSARATKKCPIR